MNYSKPPSVHVKPRTGTQKFVLQMLVTVLFLTQTSFVFAQSTPVAVGYRDFVFNATSDNEPAAEKPQSKLWWNDGFWWGSLWSNALDSYAIYRFDVGTQSWTSTGTTIDDRTDSKADVLWDGTHLYVASGIHTLTPGSANAAQSARLYRYSYNSGSHSYSLDAGFPVNVNSSKSETLVLDKDSTGKLWVTWTQSNKVKINCTIGDDLTWGTPFDLPVLGSDVNPDDISSVVALAGGKIGVAWNNNWDNKFYFAVHNDGDPDATWQPREEALGNVALDPLADDHLNLKMSTDGSGNLYAAVKTSMTTPEGPHVYVLKRSSAGVWSSHLVGKVKDGHTRPMILIDNDNQKAYVFFMSDVINGGKDEIYMKSTSLSALAFPEGVGTPFILSDTEVRINNPTSTKQSVNATTGLLVVADDHNTRNYMHNFIDLTSSGAPSISSFSPTSGIVGTEVTINGSHLASVTGVNFNGFSTSQIIIVNSDSQIRAILPVGATSGKIEVTTVGGSAQSANNFAAVPTLTSFTPTSGLATTVVTITGANFSDATSVQFHGAAASFTIDSATQITAIVPNGATTGQVSVTTGGGTVFSIDNFVMIASTTTTFNPIHDTYVKFSTPGAFNGASITLRTRALATDSLKIYLKFNLTGLSGALLNAKVRLMVTKASPDGGAIYPVSNNFQGTANAWTETTLNWGNAPVNSGAPLSAVGAAAVGDWMEFDVTPAITGNDTFSFALKNNHVTDVQYSSKEGANPPELIVQTSNAPAVPAITSFNPSSGVAGSLVTISGSAFVAVSSVKFNTTAAAAFTVNSASEITATVPSGATSGKISVTTAGGVALSAADYTVMPAITSFNPTIGPAGSLVTITGTNFSGATDVKFNTTSATAVTVNSATQITATVPAGATTGAISVTTGGGIATSATNFTITNPPTISSFTPASGVIGAQVTITGTNFTGTSAVKFNTTSATALVVNSATEIVAAVPFAATTGPISVTTTDGTATSATNFTVQSPAPTISSFTPTSGAVGTPVTITGTNFSGTSDVKFNTTSAPGFIVNSATQITATVPAGASTGAISVTANGTAVSADNFTVSGGGSLLSFQPSDDAYVRFSTPTSNYGTNSTMRSRLVSGSDSLHAYLKFPVIGVAGSVSSAKLRVRVTDASDNGGGVYAVSNNYKGTATPWVQTGIIWNNAPAISGSPLSSTGAVAVGDWVEFDVTAAVTGDGTYSFGLKAITTDLVQYSSQEGADKPLLVIETGSGSTPAPTVSSFTPTSGAVGTPVTITGTDLNGASVVKFNSTVATSFTVNSATQITATVPTGATNGKISVTTAGGTAVSAADFTVTVAPPPAPTITSFTPTSAIVGTQITITGTNFTGATEVKFNLTVATAVTVSSATQIRATVPAGATNGKISVTAPGGTVQSATDFTVTAAPVPTITSFTPTSAIVGTQITVTGTNFTGATEVKFNATIATTFTVNSATQIRATVPTGATTGKITVTTPGGVVVSAADFTVTVPGAPTITSFTPTSALVGTQITVTGTNFTGATEVKFNATIATTFTVNSATQIRATVPTGATTGKITVTTPGGVVVSAADFTVTVPGAPTITSFTPTSALVGTQITVTGTNFTGATEVKFNATVATTFTVNSATQIRATVPAGATTGKITVTTPGGTILSATDFTVTVAGAPTITSFTPTSALVGTQITITGTNFTGATEVKFNTTVATTFTVNSATQIRAIVPTGATTGKITVTTPGGVVVSVADFTVTVPGAPTITSFTPTSAIVGTQITVTGTNFTGATEVKFNATVATTFTVNSATQIRATVPTGATSGKITVTTPGGVVVSVADFTVTVPGAPTITSFTPTSAIVGTQITVTGTNFTGATEVKFNATVATTFTVNSATQIRATVPTGATTGKISVTTAGGTIQSAADFTVTVPGAPTITSFTPASAPVGTQITITGTNFTGASGVTFNGLAATTFSVNSATQIRATVPVGATNGQIGVTAPGGAVLSANSFTVTIAAPTISSFAPSGGGEGTVVTVTGANFSGASDVKFNTTSAPVFTVNSATQITATVPTGATTGKISVTTPGGTVVSANNFTVTPPGVVVTTFNSTHDTYVRKGSPTSNFGTRTTVIVKKTSSDTYNAFFKFSVSGLSGSVVNAKLRLMVKNSSNDAGGVYLVSNDLLGTATPWTQTAMNWNNAPAISGSALSSLGTVTNNAIVEFDVTAAITGDGTYSFGVQNNSTNDVQYSTLEGTFKPELVVQAGSIPILPRQDFEDNPEQTATANDLPQRFALSPNYPNPFNAQTTIEYALPHEAHVRLLIYNSIGQLVRKLVDQPEAAGYKRVAWNATDDHGLHVGSGVYFYQVEADALHLNGRMILQQ